MHSYTVTPETIEGLASSWPEWRQRLQCELFVLPWWLKVWCRSFGSGENPHLLAVRDGGSIIGIAPLLRRDNTVCFAGNSDVCDYQDFIVAQDNKHDFFDTLLRHLGQEGIRRLDLRPLRPDSTVMSVLTDMARSRGYQVSCKQEDVSLESDLPGTWEEYLDGLTGKQRHELTRKLRKLAAAGAINYRLLQGDEAAGSAFDAFLTQFRESRTDKATFLTPDMEAFFRALARASAEAQVLRLGVLELDKLMVAAVMCFDYNDEMYLYNSGFDARYRSLSVGLISKAYCIRACIEQKKRRFNFLKGDEEYKYHLGGKEVPISSCEIILNG
ncbi:MAG: GNAT family N-acetyltransferase [Dehalococcoidia bacterium]|nr:GNAT family N-acetyltransferase [Dehalococcoidia bacterium]